MAFKTTNNSNLTGKETSASPKTKAQILLDSRQKTLENIKNNMDTLNKEIEKTEQLRAQFLSNVSHEIKTPLNSILSATLLLQQKSLDTESAELVETIHRSGQYLFSLLNDVLDYYKLASHQLALDNINFDLQNELNEVVAVFKKKAKEKEIDFRVSFDKHLPAFLRGDAMRLKQILTNLLDNAVKFTPSRGRINLDVQPVSFKNGKHEIQFSVRDTGIGIPEGNQQEIWEKFSMGDMSLTRENQGTGLGLPLSRRLCHLLGGSMYLESKPNRGSTFYFTVKMEPGQDENDNTTRGILDILLVEDNLINQKLTQKILMKQGFHVDVAGNGKEAVEKFKNAHYDLIFMDIQMPVMDGLEATRQIRCLEALRQTSDHVKIIALTANSQQQDKENCLAAGMDDYINKPFNVNKFPLILSNIH